MLSIVANSDIEKFEKQYKTSQTSQESALNVEARNNSKPSKEITGIQNYSDFLLKELNAKKIKYSLINPAENNKLLKKFVSLFGINSEKILNDFPIFLNIPKIGTTHFTSQQQAIALLFSKPIKAVVTVHDIVPLATDTYDSFFEKILYKLAYRGLKKADILIADSQSTKNDIIHYLKIENQRLGVA